MKPKVAILMGSDSDLPIMQQCAEVLNEAKVPFTMEIISAHRTPEKLTAFLTTHIPQGLQIVICGAGAAAHLAGAVAAHCTLPVIGVPLPGSDLQGLDSLLATVQMPGGVPVATMAIGKAGAINAALFAIEILSLNHDPLREWLNKHREQQKQAVAGKSGKLQQYRKQFEYWG